MATRPIAPRDGELSRPGIARRLGRRNNTPRLERVLLARGRDAADVATSTTLAPNTLESFGVWTDEVKGPLAWRSARVHRRAARAS